ncbi:ComEC/Rec2 family competence protein [Sulfurimonas lithotrophica]|uniref:ComEC/Rec2 family competence protein n=1 Tax=Sulfurimonas lithotrophica TaxID=2590022 RepID=A0A5P8P2J8_9BACT|nr:ComEC/Rec2 family competence protein [Sulfurimonas lithotrophica]QFR49929.1 ComEC/Rec2 family competence protein [Sulfurimonas lithotrophica]
MQLQRLELFSTKKEFLSFLGICLFILFYALLIEYNNYKNLTRFNTALVDAVVSKQYTKTKLTKNGKRKTYQVLKLKADKGFSFYTSAKKDFQNVKDKKLNLEIYTSKISFYEYLTSFYAYSRIKNVDEKISIKERLNDFISKEHTDSNIASIYKALYTATPLNSDLQTSFSNLGISHLLAISGFHLGVLASVLFFMFKLPYKFLQQRYFPYRSYKVDSFIFISITLLAYLLFLDSPPSLLRAFTMLILGFVLYDRGYKIISMQTLLLTVMILLSFSPRLFFSIGFWLSVSGVFYIFLFLIHFKHLSKFWQFVLVPFWVYFMMIPFSVVIFGNFSIYHPLSILWTTLFTLFYPLSILGHLIGQGDIFDSILSSFLSLSSAGYIVNIGLIYLVLHIFLSIVGTVKKPILIFLLIESLLIFLYSLLK